MDLMKSLAKAKREGLKPPSNRKKTTAYSQVVKTIDNESWTPPSYTESKRVNINMDTAEEMRCVCLFPDTRESDAYNVARTHIQNATQSNGWKTVMFTSTMPGEGKTLTCINLALSFAKSFNQTILLVDNDLRRQKIHQYLGIRNHVGLRDYLIKDRPLKDVIVWPGIAKFALISGGKTISASSELMGSPKMKSMVNEMKTRYTDRYIFFDTPPILGGADAMTFLQLVDCVVMVVEAEKTPRDDIQKARALIPDEKFLGFILNRQKITSHSYYEYYTA